MRRTLMSVLALFLAAPALAVIPISEVEGNSGQTVLTITINHGPNNPPATYTWQTLDGTATAADNDYVPTSGSVVLGVGGQFSTTIEVTINGDTAFENDETFTLEVTNVQNGPYQITILNDDAPSLSVAGASITEGNSGTTALTFTATLSQPAGTTVTASYQTGGGSATPGVDYVAAQGTLTFAPGEQTKPVSVLVNGDTLVEPNETFNLTVTPNAGTGGTGVGTIVNDDVLALSVSSSSVKEGNSGTTPLTFDLTLAQPSSVEVIASYVTEDGTARAGEDFQSAQGTVVFAPNETRKTVSVSVIGDATFEEDEQFALAASVGGAASVRGTGTILNDDIPPPSSLTIVSGNNQQGLLGAQLAQPLVVQVRDLRGGAAAGVTVQWRVTKGYAKVEPSTSTTDAQGRASTSVTLESVGAIEIEASVAGLTPVKFTVGSSTSFELRAHGPVAVPVAHVLDQICARNEQTFAAVCRALSVLPELTPTLERIAPQTSGAQAKLSSEFISSTTADIRNRLRALRRGTARVSLQGLSLFQHGRAVPVATLASAFLPQATDAGAPDDEYNGWSAFISGNLGDGERKTREGELGFDLETRGVMAGVDRLIGAKGIAGVSVNWMGLDSELSEGTGSVDTTGYALSVYASRGGADGAFVDGSLTVGRNNYDAEHVVDIAGMPLARATSENDASVYALTAGTGYAAHRGRGDFDFSLSGTWSRTDIDDLTEEGSGPLILFVQGHEIESLVATAGVSARGAWPVPFGTLLPGVRAELVHEFESDARLVTARFVRDSLGTSFTVPVDQPDANYGRIAAGLQAEFGYGVSAFVEISQDVMRSDLKFRTLQFQLRKAFR